MTTCADGPQVDLMDLTPFIAGEENQVLGALREHQPLHWNDEADGPGFWSLTRYDDVVKVVSDPATFINGDGTLRKLAAPHLRAMRVKEWQQVIDECVDTLLDDLEAKGEVELVKTAAALLPIQVLGQVLGVPREDCGLLLDWTNRVISDDPEYMRGPDEKERARNEMFDYFKQLTEQRRDRPRNDLVSKLVLARLDGEPLPWKDLAAYYFVLVGAGNETTRNLITGTVLAFEEFPDQWDRLVGEPELLGPAIEEMLRYLTPIRAMRRTATKDVEWDGQTIRAGDKVVCWFQAANRDPEVFSDPDTVKIDRSPNDHVGFGWGIHACMGSHLARAEVATFFRKVLERGIRIRPLAQPDRLHTNQFNAYKRLQVAIEKEGRP
jgi:cytochrome P450